MDIAQIGFQADTSALKDAKASLDALVPSATKTEAAAEKAGVALSGAGAAGDAAARGFRNADAAAGNSAKSVTRLAEGYDLLTGKVNGSFLGISNNLQKLDLIPRKFDAASKAIKFTAQDTLNLSRQFADIGVTAAMGMSPFMIAIQQGPQLLDILQNKAATTGQSLTAVFRAAGVAIWTALAPLLPFILGIAAVVGTVAAAFALGTREINKGNQSVIDGLGLTEKQLERVKKAGVDTGVTIGDTFFAFFSVIGDRLQGAFAGPLKWLADAWTATLDFITKYGTVAIEFIVGGFVGAVYAIKAAWKLLPAAIGDAVYSATNLTLEGIDFLINKAIDGLNVLISYADTAAEKVGLSGIGQIGSVSVGRVNNPYAGQGAAFGSAIADGFKQGLSESKGMLSRFWADVEKQARENARKRILDAAGPAAKGAKDKKGGKSDGEKFEDIVAGAERDILVEQARAKAVDLSAEAAIKLAYETKLLNEAQQKGIKLTDAMRGVLSGLADAYAKAKVAADNAVALRDIFKGADAQIAAIKQQTELVGLYGRELAYATEMQRLLNEARAKGMTPEAIAAARPEFEGKANQSADAQAELDRKKFMEEQRRASHERMEDLKVEAATIGMSADEANRYRIEMDMLAEARRRNIDLTPEEIAALRESAQAQADIENQIRKTREALDNTKSGVKSFVHEMKSGLEEGKSLWSAFADAAINALNRVIDKLLDKALDAAIDALFKKDSGGNSVASGIGSAIGALFNAKGNAFNDNGVTAFAKGAGFSNSVVSKPTLFAFGKGGSNLGIMGEKGDEAVMPLTRGPDGSLGVEMYGGGGNSGGTVYAPSVNVDNHYTIAGAVSAPEISMAIRASAEQTKKELERSLPQIINEFQRNGTTG